MMELHVRILTHQICSIKGGDQSRSTTISDIKTIFSSLLQNGTKIDEKKIREVIVLEM